ncbi:MAG: right-handed parallel beta-helix repeat-containing protein [Armatimonadetes bacterium]|nr:right-handed parallel beta-helix repeat-containing protein [Armatimonadota bacterium]
MRIIWMLLLLMPCLMAGAATLYVAPNGNDSWSGRRPDPNVQASDGPFATLERARDEIRRMKRNGGLPQGGVTVEVAGRLYQMERALELKAEDSGSAEAPILYRARSGEQVRLAGGRKLDGFQPVTDPAILARLEPAARGKVFRTDLKAQGMSDFGSPAGGGMELFYNDKPMTVARWPNEGFVKITGLVGGDPVDVRGTVGDIKGKFMYEGDRPKRWEGEKEPWVHGYWFWDWSDERHRVESIDTEKRIISVAPPYHGYGYRVGQWFYAFNLLSELDRPGEWYVDREAGLLYFWPPSPIAKGRAVVSMIPNLVTMQDASHVTLRGMTLEASRGTAVIVRGGTQSQVVGCTIRNLGGSAVDIAGGTNHAVIGCDIYEVADSGISLNGGDRATLTPANHLAENNHIHHYARWNRMYRPAISLDGVGSRAAHNLIHNAPHEAIAFGGNDHVMEYNEIHSVCYESNDAGAIYSGRDWTMRGTVIRHNYLHHINGLGGSGCIGVYLDDMFCGTTIQGNLFYRVTYPAFIGGGRDNIIDNNIFVESSPAVHIDDRAMNWASYHVDTTMKERLLAMPYKEIPWRSRYPRLVDIWEDEPAAPKGNIVTHNIAWMCKWSNIAGNARPHTAIRDNLLNQDPRFANASRLDFRLRPDSPAYALGFKAIPIEKIGLYKDDRRASWPVAHTVRKMETPPSEPARKRTWQTYKAPLTTGTVVIDGAIHPDEWKKARPMAIEQGIEGEKVALRSTAWLAHDGKTLFVAVDNPVDTLQPISTGNTWGRDDAVELAFRAPANRQDAPILILRGYPSGHFESSNESGAPKAQVEQAAAGVLYRAQALGNDRWQAEWQVPLASLGLDPARTGPIAFNLSVRKRASGLWLMWQGTSGNTWDLDSAGTLTLGR